MKILRIAQNLYPEVAGGGAYHVHALSRDQAAAGHEITVVTVSDDRSLPARERRDGYEVRRCRPLASVLGNDIPPRVLSHLRRAGEFDIVHAHSHLYFSTNLAALNRRFTDTPLAITNHGLTSQSAPPKLFGAYLRTAGRWTLNAADVVFTYTETEADRLRDLGVRCPITVVANGIDTERFQPDGPESASVPDGSPQVLFVGRLVDGKRPGDVIDAIAELRESYPAAGLAICGTGPLEERLAATVREIGLEDAVTFLGRLEYSEMPAVYRSGDVLVLPSEAEGVPRTVLEALACGTPVVTSDLAQLSELVEGVGRTVPVGDVGELASAISAVIAEPPRVADCRNRVVGAHDWEGTVRGVTDALEELH